MSLVFAGIAPHPPILIPSIGKEEAKKVQKTTLALKKLEEDLYLSKPNSIIIISPHGALLADAFTINFCTEYKTDLREFGDLITTNTYKGDADLPFFIREAAKSEPYHTVMVSVPALDHGASVPLYFLTQHLANVSILPLGFSDNDLKTHLEFGSMLKEQIQRTNKRVAVISSADLSHALTTDAPAGFNKAGQIFDQKIQELLSTRNTAGILQLEPELINNAAQCGLRSIAILLGILRENNYSFESYAYECPFGVGYLTGNFIVR